MEQLGMENTMMFNMQEIGARIACLRRERDLTQVELAEKMGISYQAVSSWERGESMPDISKLMDLARTLNVTVDTLLGGEKVPVPEETKEEVTQLDPDVAENAAWAIEHAADEQPKKKKIDMKMLLGIAPFLPSAELDKLALEARDDADYDMLRRLAPYLRTSTLENLLDNCNGAIDRRSIVVLAPFLSAQYLDKLLNNCDLELDADLIRRLAPYASQSTLVKLVNRLREA